MERHQPHMGTSHENIVMFFAHGYHGFPIRYYCTLRELHEFSCAPMVTAHYRKGPLLPCNV